MPHRAVLSVSRVCWERSCVTGLQLPEGTVAEAALRNTSIFGYNILAQKNCAFQLKVKIFKRKTDAICK